MKMHQKQLVKLINNCNMRFLIIILALISALPAHAQNLENFEKANTYYLSENYSGAVETYEYILKSGLHSTELYFNLANSYYKLNKIGPCILNYEKALLMSPNDERVLNNLSYAKKMTVDKINVVPDLNIYKSFEKIFHFFSLTEWAVSSVIFVFLFVVLFISYYLESRSAKKRLFFVLGLFSFALTASCFMLAHQKAEISKNIKYAVVFSQETDIKLEPSLKSETVFSLHEGTKIMLLDSSNAYWSKIKIQDGRVGWISTTSFKPI